LLNDGVDYTIICHLSLVDEFDASGVRRVMPPSNAHECVLCCVHAARDEMTAPNCTTLLVLEALRAELTHGYTSILAPLVGVFCVVSVVHWFARMRYLRTFRRIARDKIDSTIERVKKVQAEEEKMQKDLENWHC
jgi:hypothetical protein